MCTSVLVLVMLHCMKIKKNIQCDLASGEVFDVAGFGRGECRCTPRVCIYFLICSPYDNLSLKIASPNRTTELGHRLGQSMTCMQVPWRMGGEERAGLEEVGGKHGEEDGGWARCHGGRRFRDNRSVKEQFSS